MYQQQKALSVRLPSILDLGDVTIFPTEYHKTLDSIEGFSYEVRKRAFPVVLGGDHSITHPVIKGISRALKETSRLQDVGIIHFDSHPDIWDTYATLKGLWHGSPFRRLLEEGVIKGGNPVMIGDRSWLYPDEYAFIQDQGIKLYSISDVWEQGIASCAVSLGPFKNSMQ